MTATWVCLAAHSRLSKPPKGRGPEIRIRIPALVL